MKPDFDNMNSEKNVAWIDMRPWHVVYSVKACLRVGTLETRPDVRDRQTSDKSID